MAVDDPRVLRRDGNVRQEADHQPRADGRAMHCGNDDLGAIDHVVDDIARLAPDPRAHVGLVGDVLHEREVAAGREPASGTADDGHPDIGVAIDVAPDVGQLAVHAMAGGRQLAILRAHDDLDDARLQGADMQILVVRVVHCASSTFVFNPVRRILRRGGAAPFPYNKQRTIPGKT